MKHWLYLALSSLICIGCTQAPPTTSSPDADAVPNDNLDTAAPPPDINTFRLDEIDIRGCGMSLWPEAGDPRDTGFYLFNGMVSMNAEEASPYTMRMKIDGDIMRFERIEGSGDQFYGQYEFQSFIGPAGDISVTVLAEPTPTDTAAEVSAVTGTITVNRNGNEATVEAVGDAGC